jgi:hypothetical protein
VQRGQLKVLTEKMVYRLRNREFLKTTLYFRYGNLQIYPLTHMKV